MTARSSKLALIHIAKKTLGLDDETYRDMIEMLFKVRSSGDLTGPQLDKLIDHMKSKGFRPVRKKAPAGAADRAAKIRMLWVTLWDLGVVRDPSERALLAFVKRLTAKQALQWVSGKDAGKVIEALKDWAGRDGGVDWSSSGDPRACVVKAQWRRLGKLAQLQTPNVQGLTGYLSTYLSTPEAEICDLDNDQLDGARAHFGKWIRKALKVGQA